MPPTNMPDPNYKAFFAKRGFVVKKVEKTERGFAVYINDPDEARKLYSQTPDSRYHYIEFIPTDKPKPIQQPSENILKRVLRWIREKL